MKWESAAAKTVTRPATTGKAAAESERAAKLGGDAMAGEGEVVPTS